MSIHAEGTTLYKNKTPDGRCNLSGSKIRKLRMSLPQKTSQRAFAELLQLHGLDVDKNAVQRMESGQRFITDIELKVIASIFKINTDELLK